MAVTLDLMEYANDAAAQAAYVSNDLIPPLLLLWSRMGAAGEITGPEVGEAGAITGGSYAACKFDNGFQVDANGEYVEFDNSDVPTAKGAIEFWFKPFWDKDYGSDVELFELNNGGEVGEGAILAVFYEGTDLLQFQISVGGVAYTCTWEPTWSANDLVHLRFVYDKDAGFDAAKTMAVYADNVQVTSTTDVFVACNWGAVKLRVGNRGTNDRNANGIIDNIKIWNDTVIDSDKEREDSYNLQCYSDDTIEQQGSYCLRGFAIQTDSLNNTLTRSGLAIDLSGLYDKHLYIRASRTGSNIKIGIHDSGGTTTEVTPNIALANTWQEVITDISGVADENKNDIDSIIVTIVNADADNTFYLDDFYGMTVALRERSIVYDSILELSKTRDIVYDSVLELSKTRNMVYDSVLELSRERNIVYDSILELSRERNIVYDSILELSRVRNIVYDLVLELSRERNILYDSVLELSKERSIVYDLYEVIQRLTAPTGVWARQSRPTGVPVRQDRPAGAWTRQSRPFR